jgi:hypothetical protein
MSQPSVSRHHADWLSLVEVSGPFVSLPVLMRIFPQGLEPRDPAQADEKSRAGLKQRKFYRDDLALKQAVWTIIIETVSAFWPRHHSTRLKRARES